MPTGARLAATDKTPGHRHQKWWVPQFSVPTLDFPDFSRNLKQVTNGSTQTSSEQTHSAGGVTLPHTLESSVSSPFCVMLPGRHRKAS